MTRPPDEIDEELLVLRCRRRADGAWDELVSRFHDRLFYFVRRLISDEDRAGQLIQEAWLQILRSFDSLRQADRLTPWLYTIVRRTVLTEMRRQYAAAAESRGDLTDDNHPLESGDESTTAWDDAELVHFGLQKIGLCEREVLTLFFLEEMSIDEVAQVLEIPPGTVKSRLSRARRELRRVLETEIGGCAPEDAAP